MDTQKLPAILLSVSAVACSRAPTLLVENTSDAPQVITINGDSDLFAVDTIPPSRSWCWTVPDVARREVYIHVARVLDTTGVAAIDAHAMDDLGYTHRSHFDSLSLSRSWRLRVRMERFVEGSKAWQRRRAELDRRIELMLQRERVPSAERSPLRLIYLLPLAGLPDETHWEQTVEAQPVGRCTTIKPTK